LNLRATLAVTFLLSATLLSVGAYAQTNIFNNYNPAPGFSTTNSVHAFEKNATESVSNSTQHVALSFTASQQFNTLAFDLPLQLVGGNAGNFSVMLETNSGAAPSGTSIFSSTGTATSTATIFTFTPAATLSINPGTYWVVLAGTSNFSDIAWLDTNGTATGYSTQDKNGTWTAQTGISPALRVRGNPVPEFGSVWALGGFLLSGGAGLWWQKRSRRRTVQPELQQ
jgi:hypothetical protein